MNNEVIRQLKRMAEMATTGGGIGFQDAENNESLFVTYQEIGQLISDYEARVAELEDRSPGYDAMKADADEFIMRTRARMRKMIGEYED